MYLLNRVSKQESGKFRADLFSFKSVIKTTLVSFIDMNRACDRIKKIACIFFLKNKHGYLYYQCVK